MRFGIHLPNSGGCSVSPDSLVDFDTIKTIALESENLEFSSIWANEHVTLPSSELPADTKFYEPITTLSALATLTSRIILGTAIVILPFRDPFVLAKEISTIGVVSDNRFVFGAGPGRFEREYSSQGKNWTGRIQKLDEEIRLIRELLTGKSITFSGKYYSCRDFSISPVPKNMSIILGGANPHAIRRAARICDGIMPGHITPEEARNMRNACTEELKKNRAETSSKFEFYCEIILSIEETNEKAKSKFSNSTYVKKIPYASELRSKALIGTPKEVTSKVAEYRDSGVDEFILIFADESLDSFLKSMQLFSSKVMPEFS